MPKILLLGAPGYGHLYPLIQLAEILAQTHTVTMMTSIDYLPQINKRHSFKAPVKLAGIEDGLKWDDKFAVSTIPNMFVPFEEFLKKNQDQFDYVIIESFMMQLAHIVRKYNKRFSVLSPMAASNFLNYLDDVKGKPEFIVAIFKALQEELHFAEILFVNSFSDVESRDFKDFNEKYKNLEIKTIGPLHLYSHSLTFLDESSEPAQVSKKVKTWLDKQRDDSVLYICLGSTGRFPPKQNLEFFNTLLEKKIPFLWTLDDDYRGDLPADYLEKTGDLGLYLDWSPQTLILSHKAVGVFLTHCGWNGTMEALSFGVPMIGWPLFAEQHPNSKLIQEKGFGIAVSGTKVGPEGRFVPQTELVETISLLFNDQKYREKTKQAQIHAQKSVANGGDFFSRFLK